jgi:AraC-like DNA-binding protein
MTNNTIAVKNKLDGNLDYKVSRFKEVIKRTSPHKHDNYYEIIFLSQGQGFHQVEDKQYKISTPEFYFLKPGQLHYWQFTSIPKGYVLMFRQSFFDKIGEAESINLIAQISNLTQLSIPPNYNPEFAFEEMFKEFKNNNKYSINIVKGYLRAVLGKILQLSDIQEKELSVENNIYQKFKDLLVKETPQVNKVQDFAHLLNTTPQNINASCRRYCGKSAGELIGEQILLEAKRYILHTELTISEIAYSLSFNDPSYFVKFFKKLEGVTPVQFRKKHFQ